MLQYFQKNYLLNNLHYKREVFINRKLEASQQNTLRTMSIHGSLGVLKNSNNYLLNNCIIEWKKGLIYFVNHSVGICFFRKLILRLSELNTFFVPINILQIKFINTLIIIAPWKYHYENTNEFYIDSYSYKLKIFIIHLLIFCDIIKY